MLQDILITTAAAVTAARRWKINPGTRDGVRVAGKAKVPVEFTL